MVTTTPTIARRSTPPRRWRRVALGVGLLLVAMIGFGWDGVFGKTAARGHMARGRWQSARFALQWHLQLFPRDATAHLLMAEAIVRDDSLSDRRHIDEAIGHLQRIPDASPAAEVARVQEARLEFLLRQRPIRAENLLQRVLEAQPQNADACWLLWRILDMTGRSDDAEAVMQKLWSLSSPRDRLEILRAWYFSQMAPAHAIAALDEHLGFRAAADDESNQVELQRLLAFRSAVPGEPVLHAAVARWFQREGDPEQALHVLEQAFELPGASKSTFFVAALVAVLIEAGQADRAETIFSNWPGSRSGYEFHRLQGWLLEELHHDYAKAVSEYQQAMAAWPGATEWKTQFRLASCLLLNGQKMEAERVRSQASSTRDLFRPERQRRIREAIAHPNKPGAADEIIDFYRTLGRDWEVQRWREETQNGVR